ncbi:hypothetical protein [Arabiibacter massiliensis]|uniref:hypothetical protein n=1 Tax=Arabiibacter massiliensis TaxID=1870985 RepID=UPI00117B5717|nr:hypothetical protein [Arabiibacter massiliensis]
MEDGMTGTRAGFALERATGLLNEAYEIVAGASAILDMLYERLQDAEGAESAEMAGVAFVARRCLDQSAGIIAEADDALDGLRGEPSCKANEDGR